MSAFASPETIAAVTIGGAGVAAITTVAAVGVHRRLGPDVAAALVFGVLVAGLIAGLVISGALRNW